MATKTQEILYAVVGAGDLAVAKARNLRTVADRKKSTKLYKDLVKRGQTVSKNVKSAGPTKRALEQTKTARAQIRSATTSVTKAIGLGSKATASAPKAAAKSSTTKSKSTTAKAS